jgi:hypothetical protein
VLQTQCMCCLWLVESFNFCQPVACWGCPLVIICVHVLQALWCRVSTNSMLQPCVVSKCSTSVCRVSGAPTAWCAAADLRHGWRVMQLIQHILSLNSIHSFLHNLVTLHMLLTQLETSIDPTCDEVRAVALCTQ